MISKETMARYHHLTTPDLKASLPMTQEQQCVVLRLYDSGPGTLTKDERKVMFEILNNLKDAIWP